MQKEEKGLCFCLCLCSFHLIHYYFLLRHTGLVYTDKHWGSPVKDVSYCEEQSCYINNRGHFVWNQNSIPSARNFLLRMPFQDSCHVEEAHGAKYEMLADFIYFTDKLLLTDAGRRQQMHMTHESQNFLSLHQWCPIVKNNLRTGPLGEMNKAQGLKKFKLYFLTDKGKEEKVTEAPAISPMVLCFRQVISSFFLLHNTVATSYVADFGYIPNSGLQHPFVKTGLCQYVFSEWIHL